MSDHLKERPLWWKHHDEIPRWETTDERPHWRETNLMKECSNERPPWWEATVMKDHPDERPPWWQTTLLFRLLFLKVTFKKDGFGRWEIKLYYEAHDASLEVCIAFLILKVKLFRNHWNNLHYWLSYTPYICTGQTTVTTLEVNL